MMKPLATILLTSSIFAASVPMACDYIIDCFTPRETITPIQAMYVLDDSLLANSLDSKRYDFDSIQRDTVKPVLYESSTQEYEDSRLTVPDQHYYIW